MGARAAGVAVELPGPAEITLRGRLHSPDGAGPFPAVVLLHGCSGMWTKKGEPVKTYDDWAERLRARGFVALLVDSFGPRGEKEICTQPRRRIRPGVERAADAHAARRWLARRPEVRADEIHVFGWSNGAMAALHAVRAEPGAGQAEGFRSAVAFYPGCKALLAAEFRPTAPILIQAGAADDWTPASHCGELVERIRRAGGSAAIDLYPGAHHGFDRAGGKLRFRPEVRNPSSPTGWGAHVGPDSEARAKAHRRAMEFLEGRGTFHVEQRTSPGQMP